MQNTTIGSALPHWSGESDDGQSRNLAAIALAEAMHRARSELTEPSTGQTGKPIVLASPKQRLEGLRRKLEPLYAAIPQDVEGIELGVVREEKPRLFLDMISYVDIMPDGHSYRLIQTSRNGKNVLVETADEVSLIARITDYIAHRLIAHERAMDADDPAVSGATHFARGMAAVSAPDQQALALKELIAAKELLSGSKKADAPEVHSSALHAQDSVLHQAPARTMLDTVVPASPAVSAAAPAVAVLPLADRTDVPRPDIVDAASAAFSGETTIPRQAQSEPPHGFNELRNSKAVSEAVKPLGSQSQDASVAIAGRSGSSLQEAKSKTVSAARMRSGLGDKPVSSWWLWPMLAVLLGMSVGAYLLYLYSISFTQ